MHVCVSWKKAEEKEAGFLCFTFLHSSFLSTVWARVGAVHISSLTHSPMGHWQDFHRTNAKWQLREWFHYGWGGLPSLCYDKADGNMRTQRGKPNKKEKSEARSIRACSHARHDHVRNNEHPVWFFFVLMGRVVTFTYTSSWEGLKPATRPSFASLIWCPYQQHQKSMSFKTFTNDCFINTSVFWSPTSMMKVWLGLGN